MRSAEYAGPIAARWGSVSVKALTPISLALSAGGCGAGTSGNHQAPESVLANSAIPSAPGAIPAALHPDDADRPSVGRIRLDSNTRAGVTIHVDPLAAARFGLAEGTSSSLGSTVTETIAQRLRGLGMAPGIFNVGSPAPAGGGNMTIRLFVGLGQGPQSYRIRLTARQGSALWSASVERPTGRHPDHRQMRGEEGEPTGHPTFESLIMDTRALARRFGGTIEIGEGAR